MKITAVISEFNPFHNGHKYLIDKARENGSTHIISIMGGNFLQRGNCAILNKYERAKASVLGGVDIVFELPSIYACSSAERFARGAVVTLDSCGCVDELCFGAECGDVEVLKTAAGMTGDSGEVLRLCREFTKQGYSYPRAFQAAAEKLLPRTDCDETAVSQILQSPNNTLAIEYIRSLKRINSRIEPFAVRRIGAEHDSEITKNDVASASAVRNMIIRGDNSFGRYVPETTKDIISENIKSGKCPCDFKNNDRGVLAVLRRMTSDDFSKLPDVSEGLENRIIKAVRENTGLSEIVMAVKCKRYTHARLSRIMTCAYLGITKDIAETSPKYIRVLAFNDKGAEILKIMKKTSSLPIVMSPAKDRGKLEKDGQVLLDLDIRASDLHGLLSPEIQRCSEDYYKGAVKL